MGEVLGGHHPRADRVRRARSRLCRASSSPPDIVPYIGVAANLGLIFYMFLIGLEVDLAQLRGRVGMTLAISNTGLAVPADARDGRRALPLYECLLPDKRFLAFALFIGVSMSVTAFPVLARIVSERRMLKRPLGTLALSAAAIERRLGVVPDRAGDRGRRRGQRRRTCSRRSAGPVVFCLVMAFAVRPVLARAAVAYDEVGRVPGTWITVIFAGVLLSAVTTEKIGIAVIFGAFVMGLVDAAPRRPQPTRSPGASRTSCSPCCCRCSSPTPGLRTNVGLLGRPELAR